MQREYLNYWRYSVVYQCGSSEEGMVVQTEGMRTVLLSYNPAFHRKPIKSILIFLNEELYTGQYEITEYCTQINLAPQPSALKYIPKAERTPTMKQSNSWRILIHHPDEQTDEMTECVDIEIPEGRLEFVVNRDPDRVSGRDDITIMKNGTEVFPNTIVYADHIRIIDVPAPSEVVKREPIDSLGEGMNPALIEQWRFNFETSRLCLNLELEKARDAWDRIIYKHDAIQSMWSGFVQAMKDAPPAAAPNAAMVMPAPQKILITWKENGRSNVNEFSDTPEARVEARSCVEFVESRGGADITSIIIGQIIDKASL